MNHPNLNWLAGDALKSATEQNGMWVLRFKSGATLSVESMWRIIDNGVLNATSFDHGQQFGLAKPFDCVAALERLQIFSISAVTVREGTADIDLQFGDTHVLEVVATSAGYESWSAKHPQFGSVIVSSGGKLVAFKNV